MLLESYRNLRELSTAGEPLLTVGIGVALPFMNPQLSALGIGIYRNFRSLDDALDAEPNAFLKSRIIEDEVERFGYGSRESLFAAVIETGDYYLIDSVERALQSLRFEQEVETSIGPVDDEDINQIKIGNSFPYQVIAAYLLFNKRIDPTAKGGKFFYALSGLLQHGDDLRDIGKDILNHKLHFTKEEKKRLIKGDRFSMRGMILETVINLGSATAMFARAKELPELPNWLARAWAFATYSKIIIDTIATLSPVNLYHLSKIRITDDIIGNI